MRLQKAESNDVVPKPTSVMNSWRTLIFPLTLSYFVPIDDSASGNPGNGIRERTSASAPPVPARAAASTARCVCWTGAVTLFFWPTIQYFAQQ